VGKTERACEGETRISGQIACTGDSQHINDLCFAEQHAGLLAVERYLGECCCIGHLQFLITLLCWTPLVFT